MRPARSASGSKTRIVNDRVADLDSGRHEVDRAVEVGQPDGLADDGLGVGAAEQEQGARLLLELGAQEGHDRAGHAPLGDAAVGADVADDLEEPMLVVQGQEGLAALAQDGLQQTAPAARVR